MISKTVLIVCLIQVKQRIRSVQQRIRSVQHLHNDIKSLLVYITRQPLLYEIEAPQIKQILKTVVCPIKTTHVQTVFRQSNVINIVGHKIYCNY